MELQLKKNPITLVIISRNSNGRIKETIHRARDFVNEVVVVDQSSTDGTFEEAQEAADWTIKRRNKGKCEGDRNFAFSLGREPWVLNLDDDESITPETIKFIPAALESGADVIWLNRKNLIDGIDMKAVMGDDPQCRLFKRGAVRWSDVTHTFAEKANGATVLHSNIVIEHVRSFEQILKTHERRSKVLEPEKLKLEQNFITAVSNELRKNGIKV